MFHMEHRAHRNPARPVGRLCGDSGGVQPEGQSDCHHRPGGHRGQALPRQPALCVPARGGGEDGGRRRGRRLSGHRDENLQA